MPYHRDKNKGKYLPFILGGMVIIILALLLLGSRSSQRLAQITHRIGLPVWQARQEIGYQSAVASVGMTVSKNALIEENIALRDERDQLKGWLLDLRRLQNENQKLRSLLSASDMQEVFVTARVLSTPKQSIYDGLVIEAGSRQGVTVGQKVMAYGTVVLGEVVEVFDVTSIVQLYTNPDVETQVYVPLHDISLVAIGRGGGNLRLEFPRELEIEEGAQLIDVSTNKILGTMQSSVFDPREPFQTVLARSPINVQHLDWVQVIKNDNHAQRGNGE